MTHETGSAFLAHRACAVKEGIHLVALSRGFDRQKNARSLRVSFQ